MRITLVQSDITWENKEANLASFSVILSGHDASTDLVVLPEMFTTGITMNSSSLAEPFPGDTLKWMQNEAHKGNFAICGSYICEIDNVFRNRLLFVKPDGDFIYYDKRHLFGMGGEDLVYKSGSERVIVKFMDVRFCLQICYDLRFPVWSRNRNDYDVLVYVANWPASRSEVWSALLKARAIENQCFVIGVNRTGTDGTGLNYSGDSMIIDPRGVIVSSVKPNTEDTFTKEISMSDLREFRTKFPVLNDADDFVINI